MRGMVGCGLGWTELTCSLVWVARCDSFRRSIPSPTVVSRLVAQTINVMAVENCIF